MSSSSASFSTNFTFSTSNGVSITCMITSGSSGGNVTTVTTNSVPQQQQPITIEDDIISPAPPRAAEAVDAAENVNEISSDSDGDWETEDDESVISEDDRDPVLACLKRRRLAAIEKAEKEVVARDALDLTSAECLICLTNPRTVAVVPCGHVISCDPCSKKLSEMIKHSDGFSTADGSKCPTCRGDVKVLLRLYA